MAEVRGDAGADGGPDPAGSPPRILIVDGYTRAGREQLQSGGASVAADLYVGMLTRCAPPATQFEVLFPSDEGVEMPGRDQLETFDGVAWTGCSLSLCDDVAEVNGQLQLARDAFALGIPGFGSCWAAQIAAVAAGGTVARNPRGREMGIARKITLTDEGRSHAMYAGKAAVFDAFTSHEDEIVELPPGAVVLGGNAWTAVQALSVRHDAGEFWGLQYHPEYDLHEMARLTYCRIDKLIALGFFADRDAAQLYIDRLEQLHDDPERRDLAWQLGIDADVCDEHTRTVEVRNWIDQLLLPRMRSRRTDSPSP